MVGPARINEILSRIGITRTYFQKQSNWISVEFLNRFLTAFAALGMPIPCVLTAMADEFGGPIPCGRFALIGGEEIGHVVLESIGDSCACLLQNHGVFTIGAHAEAAVKAAVMTEDVARAVWLALQLGQPQEIPADDVARLHHRYRTVYGQPTTG